MNYSSPRPAWLVIACGALVLCIAMGVRATASLLMQPFTAEYGWNREVFSLAFAVQNLVWGFANPLFGAIADRFGSGKALVGSALLYVAAVYLFAAAMGLLWLGTVPLTDGLVAQIYCVRYVSMLCGIVFLGHQLGSFLGAWLGSYIFDMTGSYDLVWRLSVVLGVTAAALCWPVDERPIARPVRAPVPA